MSDNPQSDGSRNRMHLLQPCFLCLRKAKEVYRIHNKKSYISQLETNLILYVLNPGVSLSPLVRQRSDMHGFRVSCQSHVVQLQARGAEESHIGR